MNRGFSIVLVLAACGPLSSSSAAPNPGDVEVLARGEWPYLVTNRPTPLPREMTQWVFREPAELDRVGGSDALELVQHALGVETVDFDHQMILAASDRTQPLVGVGGAGQPSAPYRVAIFGANLTPQDRAMMVRWGRAPRGEAVVTSPLALALVERFNGPVIFVRAYSQEGRPPGRAGETPKPSTAPKELGPEGRGRGVRILARAFLPDGWRVVQGPQHWVIRRYEELAPPSLGVSEEIAEQVRREHARRYTDALGVETLDFSSQMILGIGAGTQPSGGYRVEVTRVERDPASGDLTIHWTLHPPRGPVAAGLTQPAEVVLVPKSEGKLTFRQEPASEETKAEASD